MASNRQQQSNRVPRREVWSAAALLLLVMAVTHHDVLFLGRSLITTNYFNPLDFRPLAENYGEHLVSQDEWARRNLHSYANIRDPAATWWQWEPSTQFLKQAFHIGEWPFWDPYIAGGTPAMANLVPAFFFPPYTLVVAMGASIPLLNGYFLFLLWAASFFSFLFIRRHVVSFISAFTGGVVVMLSGAMHQHVGTFIGQTAACFPVALYATRTFLDRPTAVRAAGLALAYATVALASFPPLQIAVFFITAFYAVVGLATEPPPKARLRATMWWGAGVLLSIGLVSFYYLPALTLRGATPQVSELYRGAGLETMPLVHAYQLLSSTLVGGIQTYVQPSPIGVQGQPYLPYIGMVAVALALLARTPRRSKSQTLRLAFVGSLVVILMKLFGVPPVQWIGGLPVLDEIHIAHYFSIPVGFLVAGLAALGVQSVASGLISPTRALVVAVGALGITESLWQLAELQNVFNAPIAPYWVRDWRVLAVLTVTSATTILVAALCRHAARVRTVAATILLGLAGAEGLYNGWYPNPAAWSIFDHPVPFVRVLQQKATSGRLFSFGAPNANLNSAFGVFSMDSLMAFNPPRAFALYKRYTEAPASVFMRAATRIPPEPVLDRANVALLGTNKAFVDVVRDAQARGYTSVFDDGFIALFERPTLPRFFFSSQYRVMARAAALEAVAHLPPRETILEEEPGFTYTPDAPGGAPVQVESYHRNSTTLMIEAPRPGLVYASESFFEGWTATVNGAPARILPANYAFRAVAVPAGHARVEFRYWPPGLTFGLAVSTVSVVVLLTLLIVPAMRRSSPRESRAS